MTSMKQALLSACTASAIVCSINAASAQTTTIYAGGSSLAGPAYQNVGTIYTNAIDSTVSLNYTVNGSGQGQAAFFGNNGADAPPPSPEPTGVTIAVGASDSFLSAAQINNWNLSNGASGIGSITYTASGSSTASTITYTYVGKAVSGNLLQIPTFGTPVTMAYNVTGYANGDVTLTEPQICGIFSGLYTDWSQVGATVIAGKAPLTGPIRPAYRTDNSGTSFLFTNHLASVCPTTGLNLASTTLKGGAFVATQGFNSLFTNNTVPANFVGGGGSSGVQSAILANQLSVGYLSPDYTAIAPANTGSTVPSVMKVVNRTSGTAYLPNVQSTQLALNNTAAYFGNNTTDPSTGLPYPQNAFAPIIPNPASGYPIVGYTYWGVAQCYLDPNVATGIKNYITNLYGQPLLVTQLAKAGFVPASTSLQSQVKTQLLASTQPTGIENPAVCTGIGR